MSLDPTTSGAASSLEQTFGQLIAPGLARDLPVVVPTHFCYDGADTIELHLHR